MVISVHISYIFGFTFHFVFDMTSVCCAIDNSGKAMKIFGCFGGDGKYLDNIITFFSIDYFDL